MKPIIASREMLAAVDLRPSTVHRSYPARWWTVPAPEANEPVQLSFDFEPEPPAAPAPSVTQ